MKKIKGYTEEEVFKIIQSTIKRLSSKFVFGIYDEQDIRQEAFIMALESIEKYHQQVPLEVYLYICIKSRLQTFKRDNTMRHGAKCSFCSYFDPSCENCLKRQKNEYAKNNLLHPLDITRVRCEDEPNLQTIDVQEDVSEIELLKKIDRELPKEFREDYLKMRDGMYIQKKRRTEIEDIIYSIIKLKEDKEDKEDKKDKDECK